MRAGDNREIRESREGRRESRPVGANAPGRGDRHRLSSAASEKFRRGKQRADEIDDGRALSEAACRRR